MNQNYEVDGRTSMQSAWDNFAEWNPYEGEGPIELDRILGDMYFAIQTVKAKIDDHQGTITFVRPKKER